MKDSKILPSLRSHKGSHNFGISEISSKLPTQVDGSHADRNIECREPVWKCRFVVVLIGFFIFFYINGYRLNLSVTLVAMVNNTALTEKSGVKSQSCPGLMANTTAEQHLGGMEADGEFIWSPKIQGYILSGNYIGYVAMQIPAGVLVERFGCKWFLFASAFVTGVLTLMIPPLSRISAWSLVAINTLRGIAQGLVQPSATILTANWFPKIERGLLYSILYSGNPFGSALSSVLSGLLCEYAGWPSSFYTFGCSGIVLSMCIVFFIYESPNVHPRISRAERDFILSNQECVLSQRRPNAPWRKILTSLPVFALLLGGFGQQWALTQFLLAHSTYLGTILHYPIHQNGLFSALPFLLQFFVVQASAFVSSYFLVRNIATVDTLRKLNTLFSGVGFSASILGIYLAGCHGDLSVTFGILSMGFVGMSFAGCWITPVDMSPQFAGSLKALAVTFACLGAVIFPLVVGYLTNERQTIEQWNKVMFISIGVVLTTGIFFAIFGSAEVQPWNFVEEAASEEDDKTKDNDVKRECEITRF